MFLRSSIVVAILALAASVARAQEPVTGPPPAEPPPADPPPVLQPPGTQEPTPPYDRLLDETLIKQEGTKPAPKKEQRGKKWLPTISGYVQVFYKKRFDTDENLGVEASLFRIQRVRLAISGKVVPKVRYEVEIDPRAPEITGVLRDAFIELRYIPHHKLRIGQQKTPWGYENSESSSRLYTVTRTELSESPGRGITLRDIGIAIKGRIPLGGGLELEDHVALVNGAGMNVQVDDTTTKNVWGRVGARYHLPDRDLDIRVGASLGVGDYTEPEDPGPPVVPGFVRSFNRFGADVQIDSRWAFVVGEVAKAMDEISTLPDEPEDSIAWYVLVAGKTPWNVGPVARFDTYDADEFQRWTLGLYWGRIDARVRAMTTYEIFEDDAGTHDHRLFMWTQVRM